MSQSINPLASPDISDIVDGNIEDLPPVEAQLDLSGGKPVETESSLAEQTQADEASAQKKAEELAAYQAQQRLNRIRADKSLTDSRLAFMLESAGIERFQKGYDLPGRIGKVVFQTISSEDLINIANQAPRDVQQGRWAYTMEAQNLATWYRLACSVRTIEIINPVTQAVANNFERGGWSPTADANSIDLLPRQLYEHLQSKILVTRTLMMNIHTLFTQFEETLDDLGFLLKNDPDFFYAGLTSN